MITFRIKETKVTEMPLGFTIREERILPKVYYDIRDCGDETMRLILAEFRKDGVRHEYEMIVEEDKG